MGPTPLHGWDVEGQSPVLTLLTCLATFVFSLFLISLFFTCSRCYFCFLSSCRLLEIGLASYPFIQKDLGLCGPNNLYWIKWVLDRICLNLPKSFCRRFVFCCKSLSFVFLSQPRCKSRLLFLFCFTGPFLLFSLLGGPLDITFYWA